VTASDRPVSESPDRTRTTARLWVLGQFVLLAVVVLVPSQGDWSLGPGLMRTARVVSLVGIVVLIVAALSLGRGLTALPVPNASARLRTGGLYRWVRHPIYFGLLLFTTAHCLSSESWVVLVAGVLLAALINVKARWEERRLAERFPDYPAYAARTPRFVPGWTGR